MSFKIRDNGSITGAEITLFVNAVFNMVYDVMLFLYSSVKVIRKQCDEM